MRRTLITAAAVVFCLISVGCQRVQDQGTAVELPTTQPSPGAVPDEPAQADQTGQTVLPTGDYTIALDHDGRSRSYIVHVPPRVAIPAPVLIALHGGGGNGADFQEQNGVDAVADREGFVVVYPEGSGVLPNILHTWNSGDNCCGFAFDRQIDDVGFLRLVLADIGSRTAIDADRVYLTGHSNGAMMAYRFAVEASDLVAAIAPVGGVVDLAQPQPSEPVPLLHIHSVDDPRALYEGGEGPPFPGTDRTVHHEPVLSQIEKWASANQCTTAPELVTTRIGSGDNAGQNVDRFAWLSCGAPVEHLVLFGSGHGWPGVEAPRLVQRHLGPATTIINASEEVWAFVSGFDRSDR